MSVLDLFRSDRCKICKSRKGYRFCLRISKDICWQDCNEKRIDMKCPEECEFSLKETKELQLKAKANSIAEYQDLLTKQMDKWIEKPIQLFDDKTPKELVRSQEGKTKLTEFISQYKVNSLVPLNHLKEKLYLNELKVKPQKENYEDVATNFLNEIIAQNWEKALELTVFEQESKELREFYLNKLSNDKKMLRMTDHYIISSASTKDRKQALVHFELNFKFDLTLSLKEIEGRWKVVKRIYGDPELYNGENNAIQQIAVLLSKNKISEVYELLKKYSNIYVDSADFQYYWGLYYTFSKDQKQAKKHFYNSMLQDKSFIEAKYNYACILHSEKKIAAAKDLYNEILETVPHEAKTLNNLASIYIDEEKFEKAEVLLKRCIEHNPDFQLASKNLQRLESKIE